MINKPPSFKGLNIRIPSIIPAKGRRLINQASGPGLGPMLRNTCAGLWFEVLRLCIVMSGPKAWDSRFIPAALGLSCQGWRAKGKGHSVQALGEVIATCP